MQASKQGGQFLNEIIVFFQKHHFFLILLFILLPQLVVKLICNQLGYSELEYIHSSKLL